MSAESVLFRIGLVFYTSCYNESGQELNKNDKNQAVSYDSRILDRILPMTIQNEKTRKEIGEDLTMWQAFITYLETITDFLDAAIFDQNIAPEATTYDAVACRRIVKRQNDLIDAMLRLEKCVKIVRNSLVSGTTAQDIASQADIESALFNLITLCIKITARGYVGSADSTNGVTNGVTDEEEQWVMVSDMFKRILCVSLQFLNNLICHNELRKTLLWVDLFDNEFSTDLENLDPVYRIPKQASDDDFNPSHNPDEVQTLQHGPEDLFRRLHGDKSQNNKSAKKASDSEENNENSLNTGDDHRGLFTDIPLILGPNEIEVLPMIIQTGIVPSLNYKTSNETVRMHKLHNIRGQFLATTSKGRNLLKELLIFIAAWDLQEHELYYQIMSKIIHYLLINGLLSIVYEEFMEFKDIISPAQAVIMKLLTGIFRTRIKDRDSSDEYPLDTEVELVKRIFLDIRRLVVPQVCAMLIIQSQIQNGAVLPDEFPLNLWDMERMYDGIYQHLEFLMVLTEHLKWKQMMTKWEIAFELITLLEHLDVCLQVSTPVTRMKQKAGTNTNSHGSIDDEPSRFEWRNLKKLTVILLSSSVWQNTAAQNQIGKGGRGLTALIRCCRVDDANPYIREHALLAIRFAIDGHEENVKIFQELSTKYSSQIIGPCDQACKDSSMVNITVPKEVLDQYGLEVINDDSGQPQFQKKDVI